MRSLSQSLRGNAGMALPVALLGLVAVSILITGVLLSSAGESAISTAHQDAAASLYRVEAGLEAYVAQTGPALAATGTEGITVTPVAGSIPLRMRVSFLGETQGASKARLFSVLASPEIGGRTVGAMVRVPLIADEWNISVEQAFAAGSNRVRIGGSSFISGKQDTQLCSTGSNVKAVTLSKEATDLNIQDKSIDGDVKTEVVKIGMTRYELERKILGGMTTRELARYADIKFGDFRKIDEKNGVQGVNYPAFKSSEKISSYKERSTKYNWGCPRDVIERANAERKNNKSGVCNVAHLDYAPFVAINGGGGDVVLTGDHGQGMLLVFNGNLKLQGSFVYKGMIIVDGMTDIRGGGGDYKIEGGLVGFGDVTMDDPNDQTGTGNGSAITGDAVIRYNSCAIALAKQKMDEKIREEPRAITPSPTFSWFEVIR